MNDDRICIRLISSTHRQKIVEKNLADIEFVEDLLNSILADEGVGSVCRNLFGLSVIGSGIWLAPNIPIRSPFVDWSNKGGPARGPKLEIRMRFRPSCFKLISLIDRTAFDIIFAQVHHDFMTTRFNDEERDFVLLDGPVLALVALNLIRHSIEQGIKIDEILKRVEANDFIPKRVSKWQRKLLFRLADPMNLQNALKIGFEQFDNDLHRIKRSFIELFLTQVAPDYQTEVYIVHPRVHTEPFQKTDPIRIRVRYVQSPKDTRCLIETSHSGVALGKSAHRTCKQIQYQDHWDEICDIETISHATLSTHSRSDILIVAPKGEQFTFRFKTDHHARSFLSAIDGYYRLMRKWNFNLCREIHSPDLKYLERIGSHGPIGCETSKQKLLEHSRQGTYLVRRCMNMPNCYLIDTLLMNQILLTIDIEWNHSKRLFRKIGHSTNIKRLNLIVRTEPEEFSNLSDLIESIEIRIENNPDTQEFLSCMHQLKYMIRPKESDDYPALMLSKSRKKLKEQTQRDRLDAERAINQLPKVIPQRLINYLGRQFPTAENGLTVELAALNGDQKVVVKNVSDISSRRAAHLDFVFHLCPNGHKDLDLAQNLRSSQMRIDDWTFVRSGLFAETIGYVVSGSIVQEYFPLGRLDIFLSENREASQIVRLAASLQLAQALLFLSDQRIIHGKIRCRNIMVKQAHPIQIKLTDPMGSLDVERDQAFIPPEYFSSNIQVCVKKFYTGLDVWAAGTTMWQIFNDGISPPLGRYANMLSRSRDFPDKVWSIIESCWIIQPTLRAPPRILYRDLFDLIVWERGSHDYFRIPQNNHSNLDHHLSITSAEVSSASGLSTPTTINSSILNSPTSASTTGSQTDLLKPNGFSSLPRHPRGCYQSNPMSSYLPLIRRKNWRNMINLKRNFKRCQSRDDLPPHERLSFSDIFGSSLSVSSSTILSTSEASKSTELVDLQSISEAFDRCVWHVNSKRLKLGTEIGRGSSGVVIRGFLSQPDDQEQVVAVKCIEKDKSGQVDLNRLEDLRREFEILKNLDHENIIKTLGYVEDSQMMLLFEYMPLGSLLSCVRNLARHEDLFELPLQKYALDIANGMKYLESMKIVHRDLALRNILLKSPNEVKICDFGLAQSLGTSNHYELETDRALPLKWYAPETLSLWVFTHKSDVWSYGVVLWEIYSGGDSPQYSGTYADLSETLKHERLALPRGCPSHMHELMLRCWEYDPQDRESFEQIHSLMVLQLKD